MWEGDMSSNEQVHEVQRQILLYKESTSKKFQKLEELIDLATQKMAILKEMKAKRREEGLMTPCGWKTKKEHGNPRPSGRSTRESLQNFQLNLHKFEVANVDDWLQNPEQYSAVFDIRDWKEGAIAKMHLEGEAKQWYQEYAGELMGKSLQAEPWDSYAICKEFQISNLSAQNVEHMGALFNEEEWSDMDSEVGITIEEEEAVYDEFPGEDKEDWQSEEIICIALGLEDFFELKQNFEGNSTGVKVLGCISDFRQPSPSVFPAAVAYVPRKVPDEVESVGNLSRELFDCSLETKLLDRNTKRKGVLVTENEIGKELNNSITKEESQEHRNMPKNVGSSYKVEKKQGANEAVTSVIPTNMREIESFLSRTIIKDFPTPDISYSLSKKSSTINEQNVFLFDPGGQVQNDHSTGVTKMIKKLTENRVKLHEVAIMNSCGGHSGLFEDIHLKFLSIDKDQSQLTKKAIIVQIVKSARIRGQDIEKVSEEVGEMDPHYVDPMRFVLITISNRCIVIKEGGRGSLAHATRLEIHEASGKKVLITIFDPGGDFCPSEH